ncbi:DinB family protein [Pedobacter cryoconitis]|uniref:Putative damage-inducible protein DinB n=1 Tax=Pedobacter cryoconitis TaxID=188932 RepID=A0A7X0J1N5_9SPHI|nr:DinB family protein [Pedobacter cryoconitis]MBB6498011.1 putative damage-inducible protein DinB [Pedobacter cryoconitis]
MTTLSILTENGNDCLKGYFIELADFNNWADNRAIDWLTQITDEQWDQVAISSFGSIRETAVHIASAKKIWIDFWTDVQNPVYLSSEFKGTREDLIDIWKTTSAELKSFIENYPIENYTNEIYVKKPNGELSTMEFRKTFPHMINHSTYHRGQLVTLLRQSGFLNLSNTDLFTYYNI